jgi:archaellum component FlaC
MNKQQITELINSKIIDNDNGQITAEVMRNVLNAINDYEEPIADELGRGDNAISQNAVTNEFTKVDEEINTLENNIKTLSSNVNAQVKELSDNVDGKVKEVDEKIEAGLQDVDSSIEDALQQVQNSLDSYLPYTGGTMRGNINMNGKRIDNAGIEDVIALPSVDLYEGRMVRWKNTTYTFYNGLWLALSDDLRGHVGETHPEEFLYQPTASDLSVKDGFAEIKSIKGNTIVWNQWADVAGWIANKNNVVGFSETTFVDGLLTLSTTTASSYKRVGVSCNADFKGHKILLSCQAKCNIANFTSTYGLGFRAAINSMDGKYMPFNGMTKSWKIFSGIISFTGDYKTLGIVLTTTQEQFDAAGGTLTFEFKDIKAIDLTQMFGAGNEPATVEEFEAMFPASNYEYNTGELLSHDSTGIKTVGFNQWDEEWVYGYISSDGSEKQSSQSIRCKNRIDVLPNTKYYFGKYKHSVLFSWYDADDKLIGTANYNAGLSDSYPGRIATSPPNARYLRFYLYQAITYEGGLCINLSHSGYRNGEYQPYEDYVTQWAEGKKISELTSNGAVVFPHGLMSAGNVYDELTKDSAGKSIAIKRCEADTANLTITALETPVTYVLDDDLNLSYKVWDFGTEEILADELALPFKGDIEYGFNAVDMIRNNFEEIRSLKERMTALEQAILQMQAANTTSETIEE